MKERVDITGQRFGFLTAIESTVERVDGNVIWLCLCDCGGIKKTTCNRLLSGSVKTCGCRTGKGPRWPIGIQIGVPTLYAKYKCGAKKRNLPFTLDIYQFQNLIFKVCSYCNQEPSNQVRRKTYDLLYNGLDRVKNNCGYTMNNVVPCCAICNRMKHTLTRDTFLTHIQRINQKNLTVV
jgi:hypothetical protein